MKKRDTQSWRDFQIILDDPITPFLTELGFRRNKDDFFKRWEGDCKKSINFGIGIDTCADTGDVTFGVGVGFRALTEFLRQCDEFAHLDPRKPQGFGGNIGLLEPPYQIRTWVVGVGADVNMVAQSILGVIQTVALPFLGRYGHIEECMRQWSVDAPRSHPLVFHDGLCLLASAHWVLGNQSDALRVGREYVDRERRNPGHLEDVLKAEEFLEFLRKEAGRGGT